MKSILIIILSCLFVTGYTQTYDLNITIKNIQKIDGYIKIAVYNKSEKFLKKGDTFKSYFIKVTNNIKIITIKDLPKGTYAIAIYHDKNSDKLCNKNILGIPLEPYGFSRNYVPVLKKPSFDDCKITLNDTTSIEITLL